MGRPARDLGDFAWLRQRCAVLESGCSLGTTAASGGSLGAFVHDPTLPDVTFALTARHALVGFGSFVAGSPVWSPASAASGSVRVGETWRALPLEPRVDGGALDAALVRLDAERGWTARHALHGGPLGAVRTLGADDRGTRLHKLGCATGATAAPLYAVTTGHTMPFPGPDGGVLCFETLLEIRPDGDDPWSDAGDSGALVLTDAGDPVGLVLAGGSDARGLVSYAMPLGPLLAALGVVMRR